ncbi:zinc finger protein indra-like [Drosophila tropicalis]|uniref:zinc finger protein indra-like n=1 Tax=Drosophila tropicalis TaxID=46794 RepID=UPI0035AB70B3
MKFVCDYCKIEITSSPIYTETKVIAGRKINDLLQIVSNFSLPPNFRIELCNVCASKLIMAASLIEKIQKLIDKSLQKTKTLDQNENEEEELNHDMQLVNLKKNAKSSYPKKCKPAVPIDLAEAVQLLPSNDTPKENQSLVQLFGAIDSSYVKASKKEEVVDLTSDHLTKEESKVDNSYVGDFGCRLCDFKGKGAESLKEHLKSVHQLQRPRIFFCNVCPKSFGLMKTLSTHLLTHDITNQRNTTTSQEKKTKKKQRLTKHLAEEVSSSSVPVVMQKLVEHTINPVCNFQDIRENENEITLEDINNGDKPIYRNNEVQILSVEQIEKPKIVQSIEKNFSSKPTIFKSLKEHTESESTTPDHFLPHGMEIKCSPKKVSKEVGKSSLFKKNKSKPENNIDLKNEETLSNAIHAMVFHAAYEDAKNFSKMVTT